MSIIYNISLFFLFRTFYKLVMSSWSYRLISDWHLKSTRVYYEYLLKSHSTLCALGRSSSFQNKDFNFFLSVQHMRWSPMSVYWCQQLGTLCEKSKINYSGRERGNGQRGRAGRGRDRKLMVTSIPPSGRRGWAGRGAGPQWPASSNEALPPGDSTTFLNNTTYQGPRTGRCEPKRDILHSNVGDIS